MIIKKSLINEFLVVLMALILIISQTTFHFAQAFLEIILILMLAFLLSKRKLKTSEICLLLFLLVTQLMSMLIYNSPLNSFMLNTKVAGLAFLTLMYCRHDATVSASMRVFFIICLLLVLIQHFITSNFPVNIPQSMIKNLSIFYSDVPLGLFLDYHVSAYFLAVYFIGISITRKLFFIDLIIIWLMGVRTTFLSFIGQKMFTIAGKRFYILKKASVQITIVLVGLFLLLTVFLPLFFGFLNMAGLGAVGDSTKIIVSLIINPNLYLDALHFLPMDHYQVYESTFYDTGVVNQRGGTFSQNELLLVTIMVMFGTPLGFLFLYILLKLTPSYRVFILLSLFHYAAILNPLIIYLVFMFENNARQIKEK